MIRFEQCISLGFHCIISNSSLIVYFSNLWFSAFMGLKEVIRLKEKFNYSRAIVLWLNNNAQAGVIFTHFRYMYMYLLYWIVQPNSPNYDYR